MPPLGTDSRPRPGNGAWGLQAAPRPPPLPALQPRRPQPAPQVGEAASISPGRQEVRSRGVECAEPQSWRWEPRALGKSVRERRGRGRQGLLPCCSPSSAPGAGGLVAQLCLTLCGPQHYSPPGSSVHGILQARMLEWVVISFSRRIFLTQGSKLRLLHCRQTILHCKPIPYLCAPREAPRQCPCPPPNHPLNF